MKELSSTRCVGGEDGRDLIDQPTGRAFVVTSETR